MGESEILNFFQRVVSQWEIGKSPGGLRKKNGHAFDFSEERMGIKMEDGWVDGWMEVGMDGIEWVALG